jgi:hypothetical protein
VSFDIPYTKIGNGNKIVVVTAGMDGDEYAGITAAYRLIDWCFSQEVVGATLYFFPIVNIPGFKEGVSRNPVDGLYPKHIYPGHANGSLSEQMIAEVMKTVCDPGLWLDLHGGSTHERLEPFVWGFSTGVQAIDDTTRDIVNACGHPLSVVSTWDKATKIAKKGCCYVIFESGDRGLVEEEKVINHVGWVKKAIAAYMSFGQETQTEPLPVYKKITSIRAPFDGYWQKSSNDLDDGVWGGILQQLYPGKKKIFLEKSRGVFLWERLSGWVKKGGELCVWGSSL